MFYTKSHFDNSRGKTYGSPVESEFKIGMKMFYTKSHFEDSRGETYGISVESEFKIGMKMFYTKSHFEDSRGKTYGSSIECDLFENVSHKITLWGLTRRDIWKPNRKWSLWKCFTQNHTLRTHKMRHMETQQKVISLKKKPLTHFYIPPWCNGLTHCHVNQGLQDPSSAFPVCRMRL